MRGSFHAASKTAYCVRGSFATSKTAYCVRGSFSAERKDRLLRARLLLGGERQKPLTACAAPFRVGNVNYRLLRGGSFFVRNVKDRLLRAQAPFGWGTSKTAYFVRGSFWVGNVKNRLLRAQAPFFRAWVHQAGYAAVIN